MLNIEMLSRLVTWAATDNIQHDDPDAAVALGLVKADDPRIGTWRQQDWGKAARNGVCQTAFCIAGGAVAQSDDFIMSMVDNDYTDLNGHRVYSAGPIIRADALVGVDLKARGITEEFGFLWGPDDAIVLLAAETADDPTDRYVGTSEAGREVLGIDRRQGSALFDGDNSIEKVVALASKFAEEEGKRLDLPVWVLEHYGSWIDAVVIYNESDPDYKSYGIDTDKIDAA